MSQPIETTGPTGQSIYVVIINCATGQVWNKTLNTGAGGWESFTSGHWSQYAIAMAEYTGTGYYRVAYPANISGVLTSEILYNNASPTLGDAVYGGPGQSQGANVAGMAGDASVPATLQRSLASMVLGTVIAGTLTASAFSTGIVNSNDNAFKGRAVYFATGNLAGQGGIISAFDHVTGIITIAGSFTGAPAANDVFVIS